MSLLLGPQGAGAGQPPRWRCLSPGRGVGRADCHGPVGARASLRQQEPSPQEMSHSRVGAAATSASAAGASGGEQVPEAAPPRVCVSAPACARQHGSRVRVQTHVRGPSHTHALLGWARGSGLHLPASRWACPVWEPWLSLLLTKVRVEGTKQEGVVSAHRAHPRSHRAVRSLFAGLCSIPVSRGLSTRGGEAPAAHSPRPRLGAGGGCQAPGSPRGLYF